MRQVRLGLQPQRLNPQFRFFFPAAQLLQKTLRTRKNVVSRRAARQQDGLVVDGEVLRIAAGPEEFELVHAEERVVAAALIDGGRHARGLPDAAVALLGQAREVALTPLVRVRGRLSLLSGRVEQSLGGDV